MLPMSPKTLAFSFKLGSCRQNAQKVSKIPRFAPFNRECITTTPTVDGKETIVGQMPITYIEIPHVTTCHLPFFGTNPGSLALTFFRPHRRPKRSAAPWAQHLTSKRPDSCPDGTNPSSTRSPKCIHHLSTLETDQKDIR